MSHTKEPWKTDNASGFPQDVENSDGNLIARCPSDCADDIDGAINARRIVACVNACRGISNADLEMGNSAFINVFNERAEYKQRCDKLQNHRDELLARLEVACEVQIVSPAYDRIRADKVFAIDDIEYDLFAAGWKAAIDTVKGGAK